jgi:hypothetical protein
MNVRDVLPRSTRRRWAKLDKKTTGIGLLGLIYIQEASKAVITTAAPDIPFGTAIAYSATAAVFLVWYLFREVSLDDATEAADDATDATTDAIEDTLDTETRD